MLKQSAAQKEKKKKEKEDDGPYRKSVSLPITEFSQCAMSATRESELQRFWEEEQIYTKLAKENPV